MTNRTKAILTLCCLALLPARLAAQGAGDADREGRIFERRNAGNRVLLMHQVGALCKPPAPR